MPQGMERMKKLKKLYLAENELTDLDALRTLSQQQLVLTDFTIEEGNLVPIDFSSSPEGLSKLEFEDYEE